MKIDPILHKVTRLARAGNYEKAIRVLEPEVNRYYGSFRYYYLLGACCLYTGDFGGALTYFRLAREVKMRDPLVLLGLAALYLRRGETDKAVDFYLEIQELDQKNKTAKKALNVIRRYAGPDKFASWLESGRLPSLYPPIPSPGFSARMVFIPAAVLLAVSLAVCGILVQFRLLPNPFNPRGSRSGTVEFTLNREERNAPIEIGGSYRYILTRDQALDAYDKALSLFTDYRDEAAKINLNLILESNASESLKNRSRILLTFMETPGFDSFRQGDNVSYGDVIKDPALYRDMHVIWRGMATNVAIDQNITTFDFLVGYDTRKTLEGIVPVVFDSAVALNSNWPLEVLGRVTPFSSGQGETIRLEGVAIHQSARLENSDN
ncbi:MAG: tetratricopeptide repeat protein [Treponema sp.]|jgi:tetratricopeptide (TPR) repeat protein|nr:tetratricopeptide repeat protein [Treponema sp.]